MCFVRGNSKTADKYLVRSQFSMRAFKLIAIVWTNEAGSSFVHCQCQRREWKYKLKLVSLTVVPVCVSRLAARCERLHIYGMNCNLFAFPSMQQPTTFDSAALFRRRCFMWMWIERGPRKSRAVFKYRIADVKAIERNEWYVFGTCCVHRIFSGISTLRTCIARRAVKLQFAHFKRFMRGKYHLENIHFDISFTRRLGRPQQKRQFMGKLLTPCEAL